MTYMLLVQDNHRKIVPAHHSRTPLFSDVTVVEMEDSSISSGHPRTMLQAHVTIEKLSVSQYFFATTTLESLMAKAESGRGWYCRLTVLGW